MVTLDSTPKANISPERMVLLLGKRDSPADGVQDYSEYLAQALRRRGIETEIARVEWHPEGWARALRKLRAQSVKWEGSWVVLQYTALSWSRRGFPLKRSRRSEEFEAPKTSCAAVFHEYRRQGGAKWAGQVRGAFQDWVIRQIYSQVDIAIFADPLDTIGGCRAIAIMPCLFRSGELPSRNGRPSFKYKRLKFTRWRFIVLAIRRICSMNLEIFRKRYALPQPEESSVLFFSAEERQRRRMKLRAPSREPMLRYRTSEYKTQRP